VKGTRIREMDKLAEPQLEELGLCLHQCYLATGTRIAEVARDSNPWCCVCSLGGRCRVPAPGRGGSGLRRPTSDGRGTSGSSGREQPANTRGL